MNETLRKEVKLLKALQNISYKEIAEYLEVSESGMYCWLKGYYDFGYNKQQRLKEILANLGE